MSVGNCRGSQIFLVQRIAVQELVKIDQRLVWVKSIQRVGCPGLSVFVLCDKGMISSEVHRVTRNRRVFHSEVDTVS